MHRITTKVGLEMGLLSEEAKTVWVKWEMNEWWNEEVDE